MATATNFLFVYFLIGILQPGKVNAQLQPGNINDLRLGLRPTEPEPFLSLAQEAFKRSAEEASCDEVETDEKDPMLKLMPIDQPPYLKEVYTRKDISSFYNEEAGSRVEKNPEFRGQAGKFINISPHRVELYWYVSTPFFDLNSGNRMSHLFHLPQGKRARQGLLHCQRWTMGSRRNSNASGTQLFLQAARYKRCGLPFHN